MHLTLHLTAACNFRCRYCYANAYGGGEMRLETACAAIDWALARAGYNVADFAASTAPAFAPALGIIFFGGEPLLRRELMGQVVLHTRELQRRARKAGLRDDASGGGATGAAPRSTVPRFHFKMTTNGSLLDEAFLFDPLTRDVMVALSLDGVREAHDAHRRDAGGAGTFERVVSAARLLVRHRPHTPVLSVVNPDTVAHYARGVEFLFGLGFRYLISSLNYAAPWTERDLAPSGPLGREYEKIAAWYERETLRESHFFFGPLESKIGSHIRPDQCLKERCELGQRQVSVAPDGGLYPCVQFVGAGEEWRMGGVAEGLDTARQQAFLQRSYTEETACRACDLRERCHRFCGCLNRQSTGDVGRVSPVLCAHERLLTPIADRLATRLFKARSGLFVQKHYNDWFPLVSLAEESAGRGDG